jgi:hypothetical protein
MALAGSMQISINALTNFPKETNMFRRLNLISATFALMTILLVCALANAQPQSRPEPSPTATPGPQNQSIVNTTKSNTKDYIVVPGTTGAKGWDGKVQGRVLVTPVTVGFDNPQDYDNFAAGRLRLNLILKNMVSGQTIRLDSKQLTEGFRPGRDKSRLTINVIVDNMSAPLSEAACGMISPSAENTADGVNITLSYSGCGSAPAQRPGNPITVTVMAGSPHGLSIMLGDSRVMTREAAGEMSNAMGVIPAVLSKGAGSKNAGF